MLLETALARFSTPATARVFASRGAVAGAVHDAEEGSPRADRIAILIGHHAGELMKVSQIVRSPRG